MTASAFKNGERIASDILDDRGFAYADGFFETMCVIETADSLIPLKKYHIDRALRSARELKIPLSKERLESTISQCLSAVCGTTVGPLVYKMVVTRGLGGLGGYPPAEVKTNIYSIIKPDLRARSAATSLRLVDDRLPVHASFSGLKLLNRLDYSVAAQGFRRDSGCEALFLDQNNVLIETMHHNVFFIDKGKLHTPSLEGFGVKGVMRAAVIEALAPKLGVSIELGRYSIDTLLKSEGAFITNALEGVVEVSSVNGCALARSPITSDLIALANELFKR